MRLWSIVFAGLLVLCPGFARAEFHYTIDIGAGLTGLFGSSRFEFSDCFERRDGAGIICYDHSTSVYNDTAEGVFSASAGFLWSGVGISAEFQMNSLDLENNSSRLEDPYGFVHNDSWDYVNYGFFINLSLRTLDMAYTTDAKVGLVVTAGLGYLWICSWNGTYISEGTFRLPDDPDILHEFSLVAALDEYSGGSWAFKLRVGGEKLMSKNLVLGVNFIGIVAGIIDEFDRGVTRLSVTNTAVDGLVYEYNTYPEVGAGNLFFGALELKMGFYFW